MTKITYIPGEIANAAIDEHGNRKPVTRTQHIFDDIKGKSQAEVNKDVDDTLAFHQSEINALDSQNYVTVDTFGELPATGAIDTIYRVANYDGTQVVTNKYAEYAWNGTQYKLLDVKDYGIDDEPTAGSDNFVKSGGVESRITPLRKSVNYYKSIARTSILNSYKINADGTISSSTYYSIEFYAIEAGKTYKLTQTGTSLYPCRAAVFSSIPVDDTGVGNIVCPCHYPGDLTTYETFFTAENSGYVGISTYGSRNRACDEEEFDIKSKIEEIINYSTLIFGYSKDGVPDINSQDKTITFRYGFCIKTANFYKEFTGENTTYPINNTGLASSFLLICFNRNTDTIETHRHTNTSVYDSTDVIIPFGIVRYNNTEQSELLNVYFPFKYTIDGKYEETLAIENVLDSIEEDIDEAQSHISDIQETLYGSFITPIDIKDNKGVACNYGNDNVGYWNTTSFKDYATERGEALLGTKYVSYIYDVSGYEGKTINIHTGLRNNQFEYLFVTDYTLIPDTLNKEIFDSIYVYGYQSHYSHEQDKEIVIPEGSVHLILLATDLDAATVALVDKPGIVKQVSDIDSRVDTIEEELTSHDIVSLNDKELTTQKLSNVKRKGRSGSAVSDIVPLALLHFSDIHGRGENLIRIKDFYDYYQDYIDDVICTGDMVVQNITQGIQFWNDANVDNFMMAIGNHETYISSDQSLVADPQLVFDTILKPYIDNWNVIQPANAEANALCYYYKDYAASKIRLIVLDPYPKNNNSYIDDEKTWLDNVLSDAKLNNYSVLCAVHPCTGSVDGFECSFNAYQKGYSQATFDFKANVQSFIDDGGEFIAWIGGHGHIDVCGTVSGYPNQVIISIDTASYGTAGYSDIQRSNNPNNKNYDCFNILGIDVYQKIIKIIRVGADIDSWMRKKEMLCIQYASSSANPINTPKVLYCS